MYILPSHITSLPAEQYSRSLAIDCHICTRKTVIMSASLLRAIDAQSVSRDVSPHPPAKRRRLSRTVTCCDKPCPDEIACFSPHCEELGVEACVQPCVDDCLHDYTHGYELDCTDACGLDCFDSSCWDACNIDCFADCTGLHDTICPLDCTLPCTDACYTDHCDYTPNHNDHCGYTPKLPAHGDYTPAFSGRPDTISPWANQLDFDSLPSSNYTTPPHDLQLPSSVYNSQPQTLYEAQPLSVYDHASTTAALHSFSEPLKQTSMPVEDTAAHRCLWEGCNVGSLATANDLHQHVKDCHSEKIEGTFICKWKGCQIKEASGAANTHYSASTKNHFQRHMQRHTGYAPHKCHMCSRTFKTPQQLSNHVKTHTGEKQYECQFCKKRFALLDPLKTHERTHTNDKPFQCEICGDRSSDASNMSAHRRDIHGTHSIACPEAGCAYRDTRVERMKQHMREANHCACKIDDVEYWNRHNRCVRSSGRKSSVASSSSSVNMAMPTCDGFVLDGFSSLASHVASMR